LAFLGDAVKLHISDDLSLPADAVTSTLVVYGGKGMGKTNFGSVLVEELAANGLRWAWLDPLGVSWGLRHSKDGRGPGIECLILGGTHGDVPIEPDGGAAVADVVVDEQVNVLIDFSRKPSGEMWGVGEKIRFVTAYTRRLFQRQGDLIGGRRREPLFQVLDEAARYVPQTIPANNPDLSKCVSAWQQLVEEGRNIGLGVGLISQRSARMNKDVSELADAMFAFRTIGPNSLGAVLDWLGEHVEKARIKELSEKVRTLNVGRALIVSPGWLKFEGVATIRQRHTFDSSATPKPGQQSRKVSGDGAKPDLDKIRTRMAETIERAKADDPKELHKRIRELEQQLKAKPAETEVVDQGAIADAVANATAAAVRSRDEQWRIQATKIVYHVNELRELVSQSTRSLTDIAGALESLSITEPDPPEYNAAPRSFREAWRTAPSTGRNMPLSAPSHVPRERPASLSNGAFGKGPHRILTAIAQYGDAGVDDDMIAVHTGYKPTSRRDYLNDLSALGYIDKGPPIRATREGVKALGSSFQPLPTGPALRDYWLARLPLGEKTILEYLLRHSPRSTSNHEQIMEGTGYKATSVRDYVNDLANRRLVVKERKSVAVSPNLF
jgi:uncharacterized protein